MNADDMDGLTPLHEACANGHLDIIQFLLENGADVNALSFEENTGLHFARRTFGCCEISYEDTIYQCR